MDLFQKYKNIREEIDETKHFEGSLIAITVRLPESLISKLDFVKDQTKQSRQATLLDLLNDSINSAFQGCMSGAGYSTQQALELNAKFERYNQREHPDQIAFLQALVTQKRLSQYVVDDWLTGDYTLTQMIERHDLDQPEIDALSYADTNDWDDC